jgi:hypothetical protein
MGDLPERFNDSCELAQLSLAVNLGNPSEWQRFDRWMFETEKPRQVIEVRKKAAALLGDTLVASLEEAQAAMQRNIDLFKAMPVEKEADRRVPVTWWVHHPPVVGPFDDADLLWDLAAPSPISSE